MRMYSVFRFSLDLLYEDVCQVVMEGNLRYPFFIRTIYVLKFAENSDI